MKAVRERLNHLFTVQMASGGPGYFQFSTGDHRIDFDLKLPLRALGVPWARGFGSERKQFTAFGDAVHASKVVEQDGGLVFEPERGEAGAVSWQAPEMLLDAVDL